MRIINAKECAVVALGRLGENDYTVVRFDVTAWLSEYPEAVIGLYNQRPGDDAAYPVAGITVDGGIATWTVTSADLTQTGEGKCELVAIAGEVVAKSAIFRTMVFDALNGSGEVPEPWEEWQQQLIILKNEAEQAADRAEEAVEHYPRIVDGVWEVWDAQAGAFVSTGVQAQGPQGVPGEQGEPGEPGPQGETGPQGEPGADGVTFTPAVSAEGVISWTNDGWKTNPQPVNIKGPQGEKGDTGATGATGPTGQTGPAGAPGISPSITITDITGGHRVTITDADGQHSFDVMDGEDGHGAVQDVQVNGVSVVADGVANVPVGTANTLGVASVRTQQFIMTNGVIEHRFAELNDAKNGTNTQRAINSSLMYAQSFYGLAKAAGDTTQSQSANPVGTYTDSAKSAISTMLNGPVSVSGTTPSITALPGIQYICGEVSTLDITLPASGCVDVVFESGSTPTVLTVTPPNGVTVKWANGFDPTALEADTTYEINIKDGLGVAANWT